MLCNTRWYQRHEKLLKQLSIQQSRQKRVTKKRQNNSRLVFMPASADLIICRFNCSNVCHHFEETLNHFSRWNTLFSTNLINFEEEITLKQIQTDITSVFPGEKSKFNSIITPVLPFQSPKVSWLHCTCPEHTAPQKDPNACGYWYHRLRHPPL